MKKTIFLLASLLLLACSSHDDEIADVKESKDVAFILRGDFSFDVTPFTRSLEADGYAMTDVWVLDYVDGELKHQVHQTSSDANFGSPSLPLIYGTHHLYFVTSRGASPVLDTDASTLSFSRVSDTFWKDYELTVTSSTSSTISVELDRIVTKLRVTITDAVPDDAATFNITPHTWYYGFNYMTGAPIAATTDATSTINIPSSSLGQSNVMMSMFSFSPASDWQTNVSLNSKTSASVVIGNASVANVPFARNRITNVTGDLYSRVSMAGMTLNTDWLESYEAEW